MGQSIHQHTRDRHMWTQECPCWPQSVPATELGPSPIRTQTLGERTRVQLLIETPFQQAVWTLQAVHKPCVLSGRVRQPISELWQRTKSLHWHGWTSQARVCCTRRWCLEGTVDPEEVLRCKKTTSCCTPLPHSPAKSSDHGCIYQAAAVLCSFLAAAQ